MQQIQLAHGNGGLENNQIISDIFFKAFENDILLKAEDAAVIEQGKLAFSTDSFTVNPLFFCGGDIGKLSVCGTCNDLAMKGAKPLYLSCAFIIEEGFEIKNLETIVQSMKKELLNNNAVVVCGDTKVVPKGAVDKIFINTTGVGRILQSGISSNSIDNGDIIMLSRDIGAHGASIFAAREGIDCVSDLQSDCASLYPLVRKLIEAKVRIKALRDATRGGVSAVLNEWASQSDISLQIQENKIPIADEVNGICELLGFDPLSLANEGTCVLAIAPEHEKTALEVMQNMSICPNACTIGFAQKSKYSRVVLHSSWGTKRFLNMPQGELLPRIC